MQLDPKLIEGFKLEVAGRALIDESYRTELNDCYRELLPQIEDCYKEVTKVDHTFDVIPDDYGWIDEMWRKSKEEMEGLADHLPDKMIWKPLKTERERRFPKEYSDLFPDEK